MLAAGISIALVTGVLTAELTPRKITSEEIAFLSTLGGAAVGAVSAYLGIRHNDRSDMTTEDPRPTEPTEPEPTEPEPEPAPDTLEDGEGEDVGPDTA